MATTIGPAGLTFNDGTTESSAAATGVPVLNVYTSPGTWTKPATVKAIKVTVVGGGAPGSTLAGGGAGGTSIGTYPAASIPGPQPYTVGGVSTASSFGVSPATVLSATAGAVNSGGGAGGAGSGGQLNIGGGNGTGASPGLPVNQAGGGAGGSGGSSIFGGNGGGGTGGSAGSLPGSGGAGGAGKAATGYGSGGGGGGSGGSGGAGQGPNGAAAAGLQGVVIVEEFY